MEWLAERSWSRCNAPAPMLDMTRAGALLRGLFLLSLQKKKMQLWILIRCAMRGAPGLHPKGNVAVTFNKY